MQFCESKLFRNDKFPGFGHPHNLLWYFQNKAIDSNITLQKGQNANGYIKEEPFLIRESNKLFSLARRKEIRYQHVKCLSPPGFSPLP